MAIINGPFASKSRGRAGEVVFAKTTGNRTAMRSYQPKVKNPNTLRQRVSRNKLAKASALAAIFSEVVKIGFAKAVIGTKMYPRNMFVGEIVPVEAGVFSVDGDVVTVNAGAVRVSKGVGISIAPEIVVQQGAGGDGVDIVMNNATMVALPAGSVLGVVVALTNPTLDKCILVCGKADTPIHVTSAVMSALGEACCFAFYKEIPESFNGVTAESIPWKYPSLTGPCTGLETLS